MSQSHSPKHVNIPPLTSRQCQDFVKRVEGISIKFTGQFDELESALGMLAMGRLFGWKILVLIHNKRTLRHYEEILGIKVREEFPPEGPLAYKSPAFNFLKKVGNFWKGVSGETKIEERRTLI
jgi:hypothetical protein